MEALATKDLLEAGVHFGHLRKKWNPKMRPYIFMERKGIHIIDLNKTNEKLIEASQGLRSIAKSGKKILFVATKKQAREIVADMARRVNMPYVTDRWLGGMLTNFTTIRRSIKKMQHIDRMLNEGGFENITKKERLVLTREKEKLERVLGGIAVLNRLPAAIFVVDIVHEHIAIAEAKKLNINTFALVDTNSDPTQVDFPIPANDDASKSIELMINFIGEAIQDGLNERQKARDAMDDQQSDDEDGDVNVDRVQRVAEAEDEEESKTRKPKASERSAPAAARPAKPVKAAPRRRK